MSQCFETTTERTACYDTECREAQSQCPDESGDPLDCDPGLWKRAFHDAMIAAAGAKWESIIASLKAAEASHAFRDTRATSG